MMDPKIPVPVIYSIIVCPALSAQKRQEGEKYSVCMGGLEEA
jgi:hypothetical protein